MFYTGCICILLTRLYELCKIQQMSKVGENMREWYRELREDYNVSRSYHEGFCEWYIKRKAPDSVRQILAYSIFFFGVYLWTNIQLSILLIELGSVGYILIVLYEWIQKLRMKKIENQLKKAGE